jgi:hypothetical protein
MKEFNPQTYKCPTHGLITGDEVNEEEMDYGVLRHWCMKCYQEAPYVGHRTTPKSKPKYLKHK